MFNNK